MRLLQVTVPPDVLPDVEEVLDERGTDYFATDEVTTDQYAVVLYISIPDDEVEPILGELYRAGLGSEDHVGIIESEVDVFQRADGQLEGLGDYKRVAAAELEGQTEDLIPDHRTFLTMMVLSTIVATTGLLLDSSAIVVGAMGLAPLLSPAISASVGTVIDKSELFHRGVRLQAIGVLTATAFAWIMRTAYLVPSGFAVTATPQIVERLSPDLLSLIVALVAGVAGILSIATGAGMALVGVMMAAALLPPAATVGIGIA